MDCGKCCPESYDTRGEMGNQESNASIQLSKENVAAAIAKYKEEQSLEPGKGYVRGLDTGTTW